MPSDPQISNVQEDPATFARARAEEIANMLSHGAGVVATLTGAPFLILGALRHGGVTTLIGASVFAVSAVLVYLASTIYHALPAGRTKNLFEVLDHIAIYLLIAGTYTPFTLGVLRGPVGWTILWLIWGLAAFGIILKSTCGIRFHAFSLALYLVMGWLVLIAPRKFCSSVPLPGLLWLLAGGLAYTGGVAFYLARRLPYNHMLWHLFVLAGTTCHYFAVLWYST